MPGQSADRQRRARNRREQRRGGFRLRCGLRERRRRSPHVSAAQAAHVAAAEAASVSTPEAATVSTPEAPTTVSTTPAARNRVSGQSAGERGSRRQDDHGLT